MEQDTAIQVVRRVELTRVGNRAVSTSGYRNDLVEQHLKEHLGKNPRQKWCEVGCLAKTMLGRNTETNRDGIRQRIGGTFRTLLQRGLFLVIEYDTTRDGHGKILAFKLFESGEGSETQYAHSQLERMLRRRQITEETLERAKGLIGLAA